MAEKKRRQGQGGATPKTVCPKCEKEYLKTAWMLENRKYRRVGLCCPNSACDYIAKDWIELGADESKDELGREQKHLNRLTERIENLEKENVKHNQNEID